jgi:Cysteine rich repeat
VFQGIDEGCASEVKRLLAERAKSVDLDPEVEDACRNDLANLCSEKTGKSEVFSCRQFAFTLMKIDRMEKMLLRPINCAV